MTSVLPEEEESNVTRLKQKSQTHPSRRHSMGKPGMPDESRSFLNFSRENLSISNSDLEQGFGRFPGGSRLALFRCRVSRQTLISWAALFLALSCAGLVLWKLRRVLANARDIETMRRDVETLKHRLLEKDLLDELRAFEEQIYGEGTGDESEEASVVSGLPADYDSSYDDSSGDDHGITGPTSPSSPSSTTPRSAGGGGRPTTPCTSKDLEDVLASLRRVEAERGQAFERRVARERTRISEEHRVGNEDATDD